MNTIKRVGLRMPIELYQKVEQYSKDNGIAVANLINFIVSQWINQQTNIQDKLIAELVKQLKDEVKQEDLLKLTSKEVN